MRVLLHTDPYCPQCGHNRDKSAVSSISRADGTAYCQMCAAAWIECCNNLAPECAGGCHILALTLEKKKRELYT